jgi:hypothetical protein
MASKKTQRAITAAEVPRLSAGAREEIERYIDWYRSEGSWRGHGPRIEIPPEFDQMSKAAVALADHLKHVDVDVDLDGREICRRYVLDTVVSIFFKAELIDARGKDLPDEQAIRDRLEKMLAGLNDFASRLTAAQKHGKRRGRKTDRAQRFARMVAAVIKRDTGQRIKRSANKDSPFELLKDIAAVVGIGPFTVEEVVRARQERLRRGEISRGKR